MMYEEAGRDILQNIRYNEIAPEEGRDVLMKRKMFSSRSRHARSALSVVEAQGYQNLTIRSL